jgi:hypothetical protein
MNYIIYGAVGVIAVLLLFITGTYTGWRLRVAYEKHNRKVVHESLTEEQKQRYRQDQQAFETMLNYNPDMAYGIATSVEDLLKER